MQDNENAVVVYPCSRLSGEIRLQGSKNSVLPIMAAALLKAGVTVLENCPDIADVHAMSAKLNTASSYPSDSGNVVARVFPSVSIIHKSILVIDFSPSIVFCKI